MENEKIRIRVTFDIVFNDEECTVNQALDWVQQELKVKKMTFENPLWVKDLLKQELQNVNIVVVGKAGRRRKYRPEFYERRSKLTPRNSEV